MEHEIYCFYNSNLSSTSPIPTTILEILKNSYHIHMHQMFYLNSGFITDGEVGKKVRTESKLVNFYMTPSLVLFVPRHLTPYNEFSMYSKQEKTTKLKALATIPYFNFHFFPHLLIFLQFRDPSNVQNLSTKAVLQKLL